MGIFPFNTGLVFILSIVSVQYLRAAKVIMSQQRFKCLDPLTFDTSLSSALETSKSTSTPLFVLFSGNKLESTGKSWCPDCTAAEPLIETALEDLPSGYTFLEIPVIRDEYKKPDFILRTHAQVKLRCVPTLFKWSAAGPGESLGDSECMDKKIILKFFSTA